MYPQVSEGANVIETVEGRNRRAKKIGPDEVWRLMILRALGFSQKEIATRLDVRQEAISYRLKQLRKRIVKEGRTEYDLFVDLVLESEKGTQALLQGIVGRLYDSYRQKVLGARRR